ncbi:arylesterase [Dyadobacter sp. CY399]|uniref:Arylesterase n=2 Tax=Dyadobacter fanqingshengii TaxID=2906443 RepID=A0A9X1P7V7_9BACT|nr:arylesterase [Dyadobacter fanqingshengii]MCF0040001.1 arylesterase [Dyadobacter fanqingshengii]USJ38246.1 arylesterase [Dyadobacter fanqingshengii]
MMNRFVFIAQMLLSVVLLASCNSEKKENAEQTGSVKAVAKTPASAKKTIVFFGNSLTAGYGLDDPSQAFAGLIQKRIDSLGLNYKVINAGVSGETTSGGNSRIDWLLKQPLDIFVLELGGNDGLRGIPVSETKKNLQAILDKVHAKYPDAKLVLAGMQIPPNMGQKYASEFKAVYAEIAKANNLTLIPFLLEGVGGESKLNLPDGIHPTEEGHKILAENVWLRIKDLL